MKCATCRKKILGLAKIIDGDKVYHGECYDFNRFYFNYYKNKLKKAKREK